MILFFLTAFGCSNQSEWTGPEDCETLEMGETKDQCWSVHLMELFRTDPETAQNIAENQIQDSRIRDFVYLGVTREIDPSTTRWCNKMEDSSMIERCKVLVSRPHLHREILQNQAMDKKD